jgi:hypothetical protein
VNVISSAIRRWFRKIRNFLIYYFGTKAILPRLGSSGESFKRNVQCISPDNCTAQATCFHRRVMRNGRVSLYALCEQCNIRYYTQETIGSWVISDEELTEDEYIISSIHDA